MYNRGVIGVTGGCIKPGNKLEFESHFIKFTDIFSTVATSVCDNESRQKHLTTIYHLQQSNRIQYQKVGYNHDGVMSKAVNLNYISQCACCKLCRKRCTYLSWSYPARQTGSWTPVLVWVKYQYSHLCCLHPRTTTPFGSPSSPPQDVTALSELPSHSATPLFC